MVYQVALPQNLYSPGMPEGLVATAPSEIARRTVRVVVADRRPVFRRLVRNQIGSQSELQVVGEAGNGLEAIEEAERKRADVLVVAEVPAWNVTQAASAMKRRSPWCRFLLLSEGNDRAFVDALVAGAWGLLAPDSSPAEIVGAIIAVSRGEIVVSPRLLGPVLDHLLTSRRKAADPVRHTARLTRREKEILVLLSHKESDRSVAHALGVQQKTAKTYIKKVLLKLGIHSAAEAVTFVTRRQPKTTLPRNDR